MTSCSPNIGPTQITRRLRGGWVMLGIGVALLVLLITTEAPRVSRIALFLPFWAAGLGLFQARDKT